MFKALLKIFLIVAFMAGVVYGTHYWTTRSEAASTNGPGGGGAPAAGGGQASAPAGGGGGGGNAPPLSVEVYVVQPEPVSFSVTAVGSLVANESVDITSEQSRRLVEIHVNEGDPVEAGTVMFTLDDRDLQDDLRRLQAEMELARVKSRRLSGLVQLGAVSQTEVDEAETQVEVLSAQADGVRTEIDRTRVVAPFNGVMGLRRVSVGAWITPGTVLTTLQDTSRVKVDFKVPERHAASLSIGQEFKFRVESSGEWQTARVVAIEPLIESQTRSIVVRGLADNPHGTMLPGAFVRVELPLQTNPNGLLIPTETVTPSSAGNSVFVVADGKVQSREVQLGQRFAERVEVLSGLEPGEAIATTNLLRLRPGGAVQVAGARSEL